MSESKLKLAAEFAPASDEKWRALVEKTLAGKDFDRAMRARSYDGIPIEALYTPENARIEPQSSVRDDGWDMMTAHWEADPEAANKAVLTALERGATSFALRMEAGACPGIRAEDLGAALDGVYLNMARTALLPGEAFSASAKAFMALAKAAGHKPGEVAASLGADPIGTLAQTGRLLTTAEAATTEAAEIAAGVAGAGYSRVQTFTASGTMYHTAGATEAQELGLMLATGVAYLRAMDAAGLDVDTAAKQIQLTLAADADIYFTTAKFRAARRLWGRVLAASGAKADTMSPVTAVSSLRMLTIKDPWVNVLRGTAACFSAGVGGADSICILPHDTLLGLPSLSADRVARNIQVILQEESNIARVADPAAGAYAFETITSELCDKAWEYFQKIESAGGVLAALRSGTIASDLAAAWDARRTNIAKRKDAVTGVSEFPDIHEKPLKDVGEPPAWLTDVAEVGDTLTPLPFHRTAEEFEALRLRSDEILEATGKRPQIFLANLGAVAQHTARATFAKNFFEAGGIEAIATPGFSDAAEAAAAFKESGAHAAVICGTDGQYETLGLEVAKALKAAGCGLLYLAGKPADMAPFAAAGVDNTIYMGADVLQTLADALHTLGDAS
ncbi:methylmalonyl-CoA mutase family protein [Kordiimonas marina]|uniref:methylmalonyl-CoA mutase family protein n=1 Tax=Kordiimonas marina TaxID=2872312 RepID=UPI001FF58B58|nr:methylmalonyl-CoA mutase family protein [Kordiimonas marina]MCJ9430414.1 methylmalonyl-CoA mutase subunit beta [Kordiimonas marina]